MDEINNLNIQNIDITTGLISEPVEIKLSNFTSEIEYIFLETHKKCLLYRIDKVMQDDSLYFVYNKQQLFIFNQNGEFIRQIGRLGKGPGEYLRIMDFTLITSKDNILIYDSDQHKVIKYNYDGTIELEFRINHNATKISTMNDQFLVVSWVKPDFILNDNYSLSIYDLDGKIVNQTLNRDDEKTKLTMPSTFLTRLNYYNDSLTYWETNLDIIYRIDDQGEPIPAYKINYESNDKSKDMSEVTPNIFRFSYFSETNNYMFFLSGVYDNEVKHIGYDKKNDHVFSFNVKHPDKNLMLKCGFVNDIDGGYPFLPFDVLKDGRMYCTFYPYQLKKMIKEKLHSNTEVLNPELQKQLYTKIDNSNDLDNPIIMITRIN